MGKKKPAKWFYIDVDEGVLAAAQTKKGLSFHINTFECEEPVYGRFGTGEYEVLNGRGYVVSRKDASIGFQLAIRCFDEGRPYNTSRNWEE